jgi:hypothetical protein
MVLQAKGAGGHAKVSQMLTVFVEKSENAPAYSQHQQFELDGLGAGL